MIIMSLFIYRMGRRDFKLNPRDVLFAAEQLLVLSEQL